MADQVGRIHYEIPDEVHRDAKAAAGLEGVTLREFLIEALREKATVTLERRERERREREGREDER